MYMYFLVSYLHKPEVSSEACSLPFVSYFTRFPNVPPVSYQNLLTIDQ